MFTGFLFAILTGIFFGVQGGYGKYAGQFLPAVIITWATFTFAIPFVSIPLLYTGIPHVNWFNFSWSILISASVNLVAWQLFFRALQIAPISKTMPFTAFTPLFLLPVGYVLLGELPSFWQFIGILLIIGGVYNIYLISGNIFQPFHSLFHEKGSQMMLLAAFIWSFSATVDKIAVLNSSPQFYAVVIHILLSLGYLPFLRKQRMLTLKQLPKHLPRYLFLGGIAGITMLCHFTALVYLDVSLVIAFKRAGIIVSVIIGYLVFGEKRILRNLISTAIIVTGVLLIMG